MIAITTFECLEDNIFNSFWIKKEVLQNKFSN